MRPRGAVGTGKDTGGVPTGCPRGAHGVALALPLRGVDGWMDGWQGNPAPASFGRADSLILAGRGKCWLHVCASSSLSFPSADASRAGAARCIPSAAVP